MIPLKTNVEYTNKPNPTICSHLNVSHPNPRDTTQINSVERDVALTLLVTESPK
jgi:hypothetical protein